MRKFIHFLRKISVPLAFITLEVLAINYYAGSSEYTKVKLQAKSNKISGTLFSGISSLNSYFNLRHENKALTEEVAMLRNTLDGYTQMLSSVDSPNTDSVLTYLRSRSAEHKYEYTPARIESNTIIHQQNTIVINKGTDDGIEPNMGVLAYNGGIVGYVAQCTENFSICISILNTEFRTSGRLKGSEYSGSVLWDGKSWESVVLTEMPKYAEISAGDTIVTTESSDRFPAGELIGTVESFDLVNQTYYDVRVKLHANMAALSNVILIKNLVAAERRRLDQMYYDQAQE